MHEIWMFTAVALMIVMVPGVDSLLVLKNTIIHGKKAGFFTMVGIILALVVWTTLAVLGLATIISKSMVVFLAIKYAGAAYLIYLGIQSWRARAQNMILQEELPLQVEAEKNVSLSCMTQGITTDLLNPKTLLLYVTLMPQFIQPNFNINSQLIVLAGILIALSIVWLGIVILVMNVIRKWFMKQTVQAIFNKITGVMLVGIGIRIATEKV
ncbi:LysE family translocator [Lysinibacillus sp. NPDC093210]|jgi:RhtB (resistance to homoserine/threonine) family protein|uniref:LysE family translocator n=1 Tax=Lysinibacillus sp. NPDC093210 TaxID=3364133 RepID=UPI003820F5ED